MPAMARRNLVADPAPTVTVRGDTDRPGTGPPQTDTPRSSVAVPAAPTLTAQPPELAA
jgi:hypothetical protein